MLYFIIGLMTGLLIGFLIKEKTNKQFIGDKEISKKKAKFSKIKGKVLPSKESSMETDSSKEETDF